MIRRGFLKLLCAGNAGVLATSWSRAPLELLGVEDVPEPEKIPDSPIVVPGVQGYIKACAWNLRQDEPGFRALGSAQVTLSLELLVNGDLTMNDSVRDMVSGGYVHILSAKPPNETGM